MAGTHGDLISEIGKLVVAAHAGQAIDLTATSEELACRYSHLGVPADSMARAIARSLSAVGVSMALMKAGQPAGRGDELDDVPPQGDYDPEAAEDRAKAAAALFPSGVRLAVLS